MVDTSVGKGRRGGMEGGRMGSVIGWLVGLFGWVRFGLLVSCLLALVWLCCLPCPALSCPALPHLPSISLSLAGWRVDFGPAGDNEGW